MSELGIESVLARTPQAKGRIERMFDTLQDRLVSVLRQQGANGIEDANRVLASFLPEINARFAVLPRQAGSAYRQPPEGLVLELVLCFKYLRTVANDNTIRFANRIAQLLPDTLRMSYARARVVVQERLDGSIVVKLQGQDGRQHEGAGAPQATLGTAEWEHGHHDPTTQKACSQSPVEATAADKITGHLNRHFHWTTTPFVPSVRLVRQAQEQWRQGGGFTPAKRRCDWIPFS